jgi:hypothetical protein
VLNSSSKIPQIEISHYLDLPVSRRLAITGSGVYTVNLILANSSGNFRDAHRQSQVLRFGGYVVRMIDRSGMYLSFLSESTLSIRAAACSARADASSQRVEARYNAKTCLLATFHHISTISTSLISLILNLTRSCYKPVRLHDRPYANGEQGLTVR